DVRRDQSGTEGAGDAVRRRRAHLQQGRGRLAAGHRACGRELLSRRHHQGVFPLVTTPLPDVRRVVTTVDKDDKAVVLFDSINPQKVTRPASGNVMRLIWTTDGAPAPIRGDTDRGAAQIGTQPPTHGTAFRIIDYPPAPPGTDKLDASQRQREIGHDAPK